MTVLEQNVDAEEIAKFDALAARWWDPNGDFRPLHEINPLRLDYIRQRATLNDQDVLDVGCGGGILAESMSKIGAHVTAIDMAEKPLAIAQLHQAESGTDVDYQRSTAEELAEARPGTFDVVTCLEMLEHVPSPATVVHACTQLVKPGGHVFFSTINRNPKAFLFAIIGAEYLLKLLPAGTHEYEKFIRPSELNDWARSAGLLLQGSIGLHYNPLTRDYSLGENVDVNYMLHFHRPALD
ncbi:MAG: bifunctional 2-polyprenyl-6-hydroxyphenol methylase/3-demethylubiquinol 3-O-methyltransferase UbiG [Woeseia sp.]|jgi:2-polyprenyl-6-hydroxyphenyl methylase / 3-demethylubiquinone-9 3-methyltransferase|nr:bifunctional 2-polyprenyl-6-hydroxyphenol methylase/3-demethylubiquinol 3-O-methyltransferase UbiG [Woeseia sp.]MBT6208962.1 bifunctional 2-polyprenyl-6-hydroxyphenol methylase/3-demethylubiquinol 3-O-methyltransferase UbiG [Woeseia sp.]